MNAFSFFIILVKKSKIKFHVCIIFICKRDEVHWPFYTYVIKTTLKIISAKEKGQKSAVLH